MTLVEFAVSIMLAVLMLTAAVPAVMRLVDAAREDETIARLEEIRERIDDFRDTHSRYPISLMEIYETMPADGWGNAIQYLNLKDGLVKAQGRARKLRNLRQVNSDYDLYSMGPDGQSVPPLTASPSRDDIIRGRNGDYIGPVWQLE